MRTYCLFFSGRHRSSRPLAKWHLSYLTWFLRGLNNICHPRTHMAESVLSSKLGVRKTVCTIRMSNLGQSGAIWGSVSIPKGTLTCWLLGIGNQTSLPLMRGQAALLAASGHSKCMSLPDQKKAFDSAMLLPLFAISGTQQPWLLHVTTLCFDWRWGATLTCLPSVLSSRPAVWKAAKFTLMFLIF